VNEHFDNEFTYRGHSVRVSHVIRPRKWQGECDTIFTILIDGTKTVVPGTWDAYHTHGRKAVVLVIQAYLDSRPTHTH